jgi:hypothetical protein
MDHSEGGSSEGGGEAPTEFNVLTAFGLRRALTWRQGIQTRDKGVEAATLQNRKYSL